MATFARSILNFSGSTLTLLDIHSPIICEHTINLIFSAILVHHELANLAFGFMTSRCQKLDN